MLIGIDFDNTIVSYDALFHRVALEQALIPADLPVSKVSVRDHIRRAGKEDVWTEMQGYVYGTRMDEAAIFSGVIEFLCWAREQGITVAIVSHKTRHPFLGPQYDLHAAARAWVVRHLRDAAGKLVADDCVFFEPTKEDKLARIAAVGCTDYVDDLPEILLAPRFPAGTARFLFDPDGHHGNADGLDAMRDWFEIRARFECVWAAGH